MYHLNNSIWEFSLFLLVLLLLVVVVVAVLL